MRRRASEAHAGSMYSHHFTYDNFKQRHQELIDSAERERLVRHARRLRLTSRSRDH